MVLSFRLEKDNRSRQRMLQELRRNIVEQVFTMVALRERDFHRLPLPMFAANRAISRFFARQICSQVRNVRLWPKAEMAVP
jgi:hypothetical protein